MFNSTLEIIIKARDEASTVVSGLQSKLKGMEPAFKKMAAVGTVAFGAISAVAISAFNDFAEAEAKTAVTNQSLQNTFSQLSGAPLAKLQKELGGAKDLLGALKTSAQAAGAAAIKLGFDDEAAAGSFAKLFTATKSVTGANRELQIAMDLARSKGISLEDATQKLMMVHAGSTKELKAMGLAVDETATAMQNMDSIEKQLNGTAKAYAETNAGKIEIMKAQIGNLKESIGAALAPAVTKVVEALTPLIEKFSAWVERNPELVSKIVMVSGALAGIVAVVGALGLALTVILSPIGLVAAAIVGLAALAAVIVVKWTSIKAFFTDLWAGIKNVFKSAIDGIISFFDPLVKVVEKVMNTIERIGSGIKNVAKSVGSKISDVFSFKAQGGNVAGGSSYIVGERGPEVFTPGTSGFITPNNKLGGGGASIIVNINGGNYLSKDAALDMGDKIFKALQTQMRGA